MTASATSAPTGIVANVQRCSIHDGPGIRTTLFLKGCPLRCSWCHNPETWKPRLELALAPDRCIGCGECARACPNQSDEDRQPAWPPPPECFLCAACADACPTDAREAIGRPFGAEELVALAEKDRVFFDTSGGGITFSGGEPLAQADFLLDCLRLARERGLHTAVDTCGHAQWETVRAVAGLADLVLFDLKLVDPEAHRRHTGVDNGTILANLRALSRERIETWIRLPLVPGVNDDAETLESAASFLASLPRAHPVFVLPYHRAAEAKGRRLADAAQRPAFPTPPQGAIDGAVSCLESHGLEVHVGGSR